MHTHTQYERHQAELKALYDEQERVRAVHAEQQLVRQHSDQERLRLLHVVSLSLSLSLSPPSLQGCS
jgi:hypothetical protein